MTTLTLGLALRWLSNQPYQQTRAATAGLVVDRHRPGNRRRRGRPHRHPGLAWDPPPVAKVLQADFA
jgi:hypothetical protein